MNTNTRNIQRRNSISIRKKKTEVGSKLFVRKKNQTKTEIELADRDDVITEKWRKKFKIMDEINRKIATNIKILTANKLAYEDFNIKYLQLKSKVLDTEEKLLRNGIDTSEYPAFSNEEVDWSSEFGTVRSSKFERLLLLEMNAENTTPVTTITQHEY
ncbi:unnamed protein product [Macrosiphum euphorbiae]|uniref:Uncharacterized protein n=1 Tax=Macrosiphum euphorbiae TaxID=13131 RepID=A0AAV0X0X1_9HEMI|nr:unnamed protein product [Macrosiphum euphorbiae]